MLSTIPWQHLMANVLKDKRNFGKTDLCSEKIIMVPLQLRVRKMIPARINFDQLSSESLAPRHLRARISI